VFSARSDPTRRELLGRLSQIEGASATRLAAPLPVSRQAVVKHLQSLAEAGLVTGTRGTVGASGDRTVTM
jgi:predicted transcriptional regulator